MVALLNAALEHDESLESFRPVCQRVTGFYFAERYPILIDSSLTIDDVVISCLTINHRRHNLTLLCILLASYNNIITITDSKINH